MAGSDEATIVSKHEQEAEMKQRPHHEDTLPDSTIQSTAPPSSVGSNDFGNLVSDSGKSRMASQESPTISDVSARQLLGSGTSRLSEFINDNLIAVRFGASASILLLTAYGVAHTPLFFRYRTVAELPPKYFAQRKVLPCRIIKAENDTSSQSIVLYVRHLSPLERLCFSKSWFEWFVSMQPSSIVRKTGDQDSSQLLRIVLAGAQRPPFDWDDGWIEQLEGNKTPISCQLLARAVPLSEANGSAVSPWGGSTTTIRPGPNERKKRPIPNMEAPKSLEITAQNQLALCRVLFRPLDSSRGKLLRLFQTRDLGLAMVQSGRAVTNDESLYGTSAHDYALVETSDSIRNLQRDAAYFNQLCRAEYEAAHGFRGVWSDASYRASRADVVEEAESFVNANWFQRVWRWIRSG